MLAHCRSITTFNSRPHMEVDSNNSQGILPRKPFNSRPHMEVDKNHIIQFGIQPHLSTHDLTWRSTQYHLAKILAMNFQLTTSHGGRLYHCSGIVSTQNFQLTTSHGGRRQISLFFHHIHRSFIILYINYTLSFLLCIVFFLFSLLFLSFYWCESQDISCSLRIRTRAATSPSRQSLALFPCAPLYFYTDPLYYKIASYPTPCL